MCYNGCKYQFKEEKMVTKKSKTASKASSSKKSASNAKNTARTESTVVEVTDNGGHTLKDFFARKYEGDESVSTIFTKPRFWAALLAELLGTMLIGLTLFALIPMGIANIGMYAFAVIAIIIAVYAISGACLNPIIVAGMMATRRMSVIRGVMYIVAELIGAWIAFLIFSGAGAMAPESTYQGATMASITEGGFASFALVEMLGACIIGFFFARAQSYKRSAFTFAAVVAGGLALAVLVGYVISVAYFQIQNNFIYNPAIAIWMQIFPTSGADFGQVLGGICQALCVYAILPMVAGVVGFYLADFTNRIGGNE